MAELGCYTAWIEAYSRSISRTKTGPLYGTDNEDLQEAFQQILAEMARPEAAERCRKLWARHDEDLKTSHLFSRQFLGIGTTKVDTQALAEQARNWEQRSQTQFIGPLWPDNILEPLEGRRMRIGYLSADLANHPVGRFYSPYLAITTDRTLRYGH